MSVPDEHLGLAWHAIRNAEGVHSNLRRGNLVAAQGHAMLLNGEVTRLLHWLAEVVPEPVPSADSSGNPYRRWTPPFTTTVVDWLTVLSDEQLREHCRAVNWDRQRASNGWAAWGLSKSLSAAEGALQRRGQDAESWHDGREMD